MMTKSEDEVYAALSGPFSTEAHKTLDRAGGQTYVPWNLVADRLNKVLGVEGWSFRVVREGFTATECWVLGDLSATIRGVVTVRQQYGVWPLTMGQRETPVDDLLKKAGTDAFKKCAQVLGVALYLTDADDRNEVKAAMREAAKPSPKPPSTTPQRTAPNMADMVAERGAQRRIVEEDGRVTKDNNAPKPLRTIVELVADMKRGIEKARSLGLDPADIDPKGMDRVAVQGVISALAKQIRIVEAATAEAAS